MLCGLPLMEVAIGPCASRGEIRGHARGILAVGDIASGAIACGGIAQGGLALGGFAAGGIAVGGFATGFVALGGLAISMLVAVGGFASSSVAIGALAIGVVAFGTFAGGCWAIGVIGRGVHVYDIHRVDPAAKHLFDAVGDWFPSPADLPDLSFLRWLAVVWPVLFFSLRQWRMHRCNSATGSQADPH